MIRPSLEQVVSTFRSSYSGPQIAFFIAGGGFSALDFRRFPGGSRLYHTAIEPYSKDTANFLTKFSGAQIDDPENFPFVNPEGTYKALQGLANYCDDSSLLYVAINSACTTDRYRRGENRAYIATSRGDMYVFEMNKLSQEEYQVLSAKGQKYIDEIRYQEDRRIGQIALALIMGDPSLYPEIENGEQVLRVHTSGGNIFATNTKDVVHSSFFINNGK